MANTDANKVAYVTLDTAGEADTVTFHNSPIALRVTNLTEPDDEEDETGRVYCRIDGEDAVAGAPDNFLVRAGEFRLIKGPKVRTVVLSFIGDSDEEPEIAVERVSHIPLGEYVVG